MLTFIYRVNTQALSTEGIAVLQNTLELNGGKIVAQADNSINASLAHAGLGHDPTHKVNGALDTAAAGTAERDGGRCAR